MLSNFLRLLLVIGCLVAVARSTCNVCNSVNKMACYSMTQTKACNAFNLPSGAPYDCPIGYICVSGSAGVLCQPKTTLGIVAACQECNKCDASKTFACTGTNSFALCLGSNVPQQSKGNCAAGYVCNRENSQICELATSVNPSCSYVPDTTTTTTTTTTPPTPSTNNPNAYCNAVKKQGNYPVGDYTETTCRQYIKCTLSMARWIGSKYTCPGSTYFDRSSGLCQTTKPSECYTPVVTTTTTTAAPTTSNPAAYCAKLQTEDKFPVGTNPSTTCRQYIHCFLLNNNWSGKRYTCPGNLYYDSSSKTCVSTLPATCTTRIESISINGVELE